MALRLFRGVLRRHEAIPMRAVSNGVAQTIRLEPAAIAQVFRYRQLTAAALEAGGQVFGLVSLDEVRVTRATGPYRGDERGRMHYRSNPRLAQKTIEMMARAGLAYIGEWHTHAQDIPTASCADRDALVRLLACSTLNVSALLMLIVGRIPRPEGLSLCSVDLSGFEEWVVSACEPS